MRTLSALLISVLLFGCVTRTEFGRRRLGKRGQIPIDSRVYRIVDTTKLYEILSAVEIPGAKPLTSVNKSYLKFYANGRVGTFYDDQSLDPKRAEIGYYRFDGKAVVMRTFFEHPQGGGWINNQVISFKGDTLAVTSQNILCKYRPLPIPVEKMNYTPDW